MEGSSMWADTTCSNTYTSVCKITDGEKMPPMFLKVGWDCMWVLCKKMKKNAQSIQKRCAQNRGILKKGGLDNPRVHLEEHLCHNRQSFEVGAWNEKMLLWGSLFIDKMQMENIQEWKGYAVQKIFKPKCTRERWIAQWGLFSKKSAKQRKWHLERKLPNEGPLLEKNKTK